MRDRGPKTAIGFLIIGVCLFTANCSNNIPDCGSDAVIDLTRKIANDHPNNKLALFILGGTPQSKTIKELKDKAENQGECFEAHAPFCNDPESFDRQLNRLWDSAKNNISYNLNTIRMKARDADTGKLTCQAVMTAELSEWGSAKMDVAYTVEKTTKGELYVEIYGLE